jgi:prephenate dehydrogenase
MPLPESMQTVAVVGVGLIGGSFGLALRKAGFTGPILGVSSPQAIEAGLASHAITKSATLKDAADAADLIYLSQPVDRIIDTLGWLGPMARKETIITDAGSTKAAIVKAAAANLQYAQFIGGHPMAGKETRGAQSADANLFQNRPYVLTPSGSAVPDTLRQALAALGANLLEMTAEEHDATVALTSHLPQLISTALAACLAKQELPQIEKVFGSGLLDMTRLAMSPADLWRSILSTNKANVLRDIELYANALGEIRRAVESDDLDSIFRVATQFSTSLRKPAY